MLPDSVISFCFSRILNFYLLLPPSPSQSSSSPSSRMCFPQISISNSEHFQVLSFLSLLASAQIHQVSELFSEFLQPGWMHLSGGDFIHALPQLGSPLLFSSISCVVSLWLSTSAWILGLSQVCFWYFFSYLHDNYSFRTFLLLRTTCCIMFLRVVSLELLCYLYVFVGCVDILLSGQLQLSHENQEISVLYPLSYSLSFIIKEGWPELSPQCCFRIKWGNAERIPSLVHSILRAQQILLAIIIVIVLVIQFTLWVFCTLDVSQDPHASRIPREGESEF